VQHHVVVEVSTLGLGDRELDEGGDRGRDDVFAIIRELP
jgi:hypothetical protein